MDIKDLDFKELLQQSVEEPFFTRHLEGQVSNQELETVVGGSQDALSAVSVKIIAKLSDADFKLFAKSVIIKVCVPHHLPPHYICSLYQRLLKP